MGLNDNSIEGLHQCSKCTLLPIQPKVQEKLCVPLLMTVRKDACLAVAVFPSDKKTSALVFCSTETALMLKDRASRNAQHTHQEQGE